jgi:hypothetical protein
LRVFLVMSLFTKQQIQIANSLRQPQTLDALLKQHNLEKELLLAELDKLKKLELIEEKNGTYVLKKEIAKEIEEKKTISAEDPYKLRVLATIELQAIEPVLLQKSVEHMRDRIKKNPNITIYSTKQAEVEQLEDDGKFTTFLEIEFSVKNFEALIQFVYFYGPTALEILKPDKVEIVAHDLQDGLMFMADLNFRYADLVMKNMSKKQLDDFYHKVYRY